MQRKVRAVQLGADAFNKVFANQAKNIFAENSFVDNGAFQIWGSGVELVMSRNVGQRMGGFMAWGQWYGDRHFKPGTNGTVTSMGPGMRQLWLDNEVLDENGVRNYMSNAAHSLTPWKVLVCTLMALTVQQSSPLM